MGHAAVHCSGTYINLACAWTSEDANEEQTTTCSKAKACGQGIVGSVNARAENKCEEEKLLLDGTVDTPD